MLPTISDINLFKKTMSKYGYIIPENPIFWKIKHKWIGLQVGQFTHSCHVDTTDYLLLFLIDETGYSQVEKYDSVDLIQIHSPKKQTSSIEKTKPSDEDTEYSLNNIDELLSTTDTFINLSKIFPLTISVERTSHGKIEEHTVLMLNILNKDGRFKEIWYNVDRKTHNQICNRFAQYKEN